MIQRCTNDQKGRVRKNSAMLPAAVAMRALTLPLIAIWTKPSTTDWVSTCLLYTSRCV